MIWRMTVLILLLGTCLHPAFARAMAVGISPGEVTLTVLEGAVQDFDMIVLRSGTYGKDIYTVGASGDPVLSFSHGDAAIIQDGSSDATYVATVDATHLAVGNYESVFRFTHAPNFTEAGSVGVLVGAAASIHIHVVDRPAYLTYLHDTVFSSPELALPVSAKAGDSITIASTVGNAASVYLDGFTFDYTLSDASGDLAHVSIPDVQLTPYKNDARHIPFSVKHEGVYTLQMRVLYGADVVTQTSQTFTILPPEPIHWFPVAAAMLLTVFGVISIVGCYRRKA